MTELFREAEREVRKSVFSGGREGLLICYLNVRSVLQKSDELQLLLEKQDGVMFGPWLGV